MQRKERECPFCASLTSMDWYRLRDHVGHEEFKLLKCSNCDGFYIKDPPSPDRIPQYYCNCFGRGMHSISSPVFEWLRYTLLQREVRPLTRLLSKGDIIWDVGAGDGGMSSLLKKKDFRVHAFDMFPATEWRFPSLPYEMVDLNDIGWMDKPVQRPRAVIFRHVLEHLYVPRSILNHLRFLNVQFVLIMVPNAESLLKYVFREHWFYWDPPRHLQCFSPKSLRCLAHDCGYESIEAGTYGIDEVFCTLYRYLNIRNVHRGTSLFGPKGTLSAISSAVSYPFFNTVCWTLLKI